MQLVDVVNNKVIVVGPILAIHLGFVGINVIGVNDLPARLLQSEAYQTDAGKKLRGSARRMRILRFRCDGKSIFAFGKFFEGQDRAGLDLVVLLKLGEPNHQCGESRARLLPDLASLPMSVVTVSFNPSKKISMAPLPLPFRFGLPKAVLGKKSKWPLT